MLNLLNPPLPFSFTIFAKSIRFLHMLHVVYQYHFVFSPVMIYLFPNITLTCYKKD